MSETLRIGLVGAGGLGTLLGEAVQDTARGELVAVADVSEASREQARSTFGLSGSSCFARFEDMLDNSDIDAVMIATPHTLHHDQVVTAMDRDLHVLCEKPLVTDLADARDLVSRDKKRDTVLMTGYQCHIQGPYVRARDEVRGFDEPPRFITATVTQDWISNQRGTWRVDPELSGGGQLYDTGSHIVDFVLWATELTPTAVDASMIFEDETRRIDTQASLDVTFGTDAVASIAVSGNAPRVREHHRIWSDDGAVSIDGRGWNTRRVRVTNPDGTERYPRSPDRYPNKAEAFIDVATGGAEPPATAAHALRVTAVTEAAYESARTGRRVEIDL